MKDNEIILEIKQKIKELDFPGTSLNNGVYPLLNKNSESVAVFYPKENCIMLFATNKLIKKIYTFQQAEKIINQLN